MEFENYSSATHTASALPTCGPLKDSASFAILSSHKTPTQKFLIYQILTSYQ